MEDFSFLESFQQQSGTNSTAVLNGEYDLTDAADGCR